MRERDKRWDTSWGKEAASLKAWEGRGCLGPPVRALQPLSGRGCPPPGSGTLENLLCEPASGTENSEAAAAVSPHHHQERLKVESLHLFESPRKLAHRDRGSGNRACLLSLALVTGA